LQPHDFFFFLADDGRGGGVHKLTARESGNFFIEQRLCAINAQFCTGQTRKQNHYNPPSHIMETGNTFLHHILQQLKTIIRQNSK
jgi:hypothetical protein